MEVLDLSKLSKEQEKLFNNFLLTIKRQGFTRTLFDERRRLIDKALKQEYVDQVGGGATSVSPDYVSYMEQNNLLSPDQRQSPVQPDEFSDLYVPLLLRLFRTWLVNIKNLCFPANGDWLDIRREFSEYFYKTGIQEFLPFVNDSWVKIIKTENQRFGLKRKYETVLAEDIAYGNTVLGHQYNPQLHYIEPFCPGIGTAAIFPIADDWRKSNFCFYYDVNYNELAEREDYNQELLEKVIPSEDTTSSVSLARDGSTAQKQYYENNIPFGKVRCFDFFCPSVYLRDGDKCFIAKNVYVTCLLKEKTRFAGTYQAKDVEILKISQNVNPVEHGILFASFGVSQPGVFYHAGPIQPFLPQQIYANQLFSGQARMTAYTSNPAHTRTAAAGGMIDNMDTPQEPIVPGGIYDNMNISPVFGAEYANLINQYLLMSEYIDRSVEEGSGVSKQTTANIHKGRKTAAEIKETYSGAQINVVEGAGNYDEQVLRPSISIRVKAQQDILREQVEAAVNKILIENEVDITNPEMQSVPLDEDESYEVALMQNHLFRRLMNFSGIEPLYEEYYKRTKEQIIKDQTILQEIESMGKQIESMLQFAQSPIVPLPPPPPQGVNPETGFPIPADPNMVGQQVEAYYAQEEQKRHEALNQAKQLQTETEIKQLMFKDVKEPPQPSSRLFYQMLVAPIDDSDILVTGAMTTISKELARENLLMLLQALPNFPANTVQKIDYDGVLMMLARSNDISLRDLLKKQSDIIREEDAAAKEAERMMLMQQQAGQVPGAQPPQFG